ncbi:hypothetical protein [Pelagicoccus sp. SDUM812005]|uniref:hypothetical protein n=1 Tax=Pelagicoccus sp. SDUM812005 TaxID=3041257 RepID=UPI00280E3D25|nr:hypothetical protein [Pelagicoccus sp. SDUM812005]MDQ8182927.1 hypothetical protein [Pelagicoccus sp. SDUM812005]
MLLATRLEGLVLQAPQEVVLKAISERPELFHYRALRSGKLLMWDLQIENALPEIEEYVPDLADAVREAGLDQQGPFYAFEQEGTIPHQMWMQRKAKIEEPIVDTTLPDCEPIFGGSDLELEFIDTDTALDMLNQAFEMADGPEKEHAIARAKELLKDASSQTDEE